MRMLLFLVHVPCLPQLPPKSGKYWTFQQSVVPCLTGITEGMTHSIFFTGKGEDYPGYRRSGFYNHPQKQTRFIISKSASLSFLLFV